MLPGSSGEAEPLGDLLLRVARQAESAVFLAAPFVKAAVVERLFAEVPGGVPVMLIMRWRPEEIANGVSDLEVWDLVRERGGAEMRLEPALHAKYYRFDQDALVGSANLTAAGLGWRLPSNIELLEPSSPLLGFEHELLRRSTVPTEDLRQVISDAADLIRVELAPTDIGEDGTQSDELRVAQPWLPDTRHPEDLYVAYRGDWRELTSATREAARCDLHALEVPPGLSRQAFEALVGTRLLTVRIIARLDSYLSESRRFGEVRDWLGNELSLSRDEASTLWQTLMRWLLYFHAARYERTRPHYSEGFRRVMD